MMIVCMDANFRLKNQLVSNYSQDPGLGTGLAYMVPRRPYESYALSRASDEDVGAFSFSFRFFLTLDPKDQHLRWLPGLGQGQHKVFSGSEVHGCQCSSVWTVGNGPSFGCGEPAKG